VPGVLSIENMPCQVSKKLVINDKGHLNLEMPSLNPMPQCDKQK